MTSRSLADITETVKGNPAEPQNAEKKMRRYSTSKDVCSINLEVQISRRTTVYPPPDQDRSDVNPNFHR